MSARSGTPGPTAPAFGGSNDPDVPCIDTHVRLPHDLAAHLTETARRLDLTQGEIIRRALRAHFAQPMDRARSGEAREELLPHIRELVAKGIRRAQNWGHLQSILAEDDLAYQIAGGGLAIKALSTGLKLCKASEVGPGYTALVRRFGPFAGHPHRWIAERVAQAADHEALIELDCQVNQ